MMIAVFDAFLNSMVKCWNQAPALLYGMAFLFGCLSALSWNPIILLPIAILFLPLLFKSSDRQVTTLIKLGMAAAILILAFFYVKTTITFPDDSEKKEFQGVALFEINDLTMIKKYHGKYANYKGTILAFFVDGTLIAKNIPSSILLNDQLSLPFADTSYQISGTLKKLEGRNYTFVPNKDVPWTPMKNTWSLAQLRHQMKENVSAYIHRNTKHRRSADFLSGIATSNFEDRMIGQELGRFGLQHIMAISGFHFAIVASMLGLILRILLPQKYSIVLLAILITTYFIFLGCGPSILRAWLTSLIGTVSFLFERRAIALNSLGIALLAILGFNPILCEHIGFQFSFICTAAILLLYSPCDELMQKAFPIRSLKITSKMSAFSQHAYCFLHFCRSACALGIAINIAALPLTFYYFQKFPLLGLLYNLFFPFMVSISMMLLMIGFIIGILIPPLGQFIHSLNSSYTNFMLNYAYNLPINFDIILRSNVFSPDLVTIQLTLVFAAGIYYKSYYQERSSQMDYLLA